MWERRLERTSRTLPLAFRQRVSKSLAKHIEHPEIQAICFCKCRSHVQGKSPIPTSVIFWLIAVLADRFPYGSVQHGPSQVVMNGQNLRYDVWSDPSYVVSSGGVEDGF
jgi:hypothetical protein